MDGKILIHNGSIGIRPVSSLLEPTLPTTSFKNLSFYLSYPRLFEYRL